MNSGEDSNTLGMLPIPVKSRIIKTDKPRPFLCSICTRGFVRQEHLKRHQRSHTNEKPFLCIFCGRCFARRDLVLRHQHKLHSSLMSIEEQTKNINHDTTHVHDFLKSILVKDNVKESNQSIALPDNTGSVSPDDDSGYSLIEKSTDRNNVSDKHIIKINGNKRSILPTLSNPLAKTAAELKKEAKVAARVAVKAEALASKDAAILKKARSKNKKINKVVKKAISVSPNTSSTSPSLSDTLSFSPDNLQSSTKSSPLNQLSQTAQRKTPSLFENNAQYRHKRHASFSASSALTYLEEQKKPNAHEMSNDLELGSDIPHQVGFSTPQLTAKQVFEKALECGIDLDALEMPSYFSLDGNPQTQTTNKDKHQNIDTINQNGTNKNDNGSFNLNNDFNTNDDNRNIQYVDSMTMLSDFLTMGPLYGGSSGYAKINHMNDSNLDYFSYIPTNSKSYLNLKNMNNLPNGNGKKIHNGNNLQSNLRGKNDSYNNSGSNVHEPLPVIPNNNITKPDSPHSLTSHNTANHLYHSPQTNSTTSPNTSSNNGELSLSPDDGFYKNFLSHAPLETDFKMNFEHLNDIGFTEANLESAALNLQSGKHHMLNNHINDQNYRNNDPSHLMSPTDHCDKLGNGNANGSADSFHYPIDSEFELSKLFTSRQIDLFKKNVDIEPFDNTNDSTHKNNSNSSSFRFEQKDSIENNADSIASTIDSIKLHFFTEELRMAIIKDNQLTSEQFPKVKELNKYVNLFKDHFHKFYPFIHLNSIQLDMSNYPLLLSISMIGALYDFHSKHAMLLSNIAWFHIRDFLHKSSRDYSRTPLWLIQSILLLIFIGLFSSDIKVIKSIRHQLPTLLQLVKLTKLNMPLENFVRPPIESDHIFEFQDNPVVLEKLRKQYNSSEQTRRNYEYFVLAQTRIRTCHNILLLSNLYSSLKGGDFCFHSIDLKCGVPCSEEILYHTNGPQDWLKYLKQFNITLDSKFSLIELSNGSGNYESCLMYLTNGSPYVFENMKLSWKTLFSLLISIHERITIDRMNIKKMDYSSDDSALNDAKWRMNSKPKIASMIKFWEALYIKNGGTLTPNKSNINIIRNNPAMLLIIPLHNYAKIRKCVDFSKVLKNVWLQNWDVMNENLDTFYHDKESIVEATSYALEILEFWIETVNINSEYSANATNPIPSTTCIFISLLIISQYLKIIEKWAFSFKLDNNTRSTTFNVSDRVMWMKILEALRRIQKHLLATGYHMNRTEVINEQYVKHAMKPNTPIQETTHIINSIGLSSHCLYIGVRVLSASPVWSISFVFAQALQSRAIYNDMDIFVSHHS